MAVCLLCNKKTHKTSWSRHQKGSSGASEWPLRAQIHKRIQKPNLHTYKGSKFCTKCLRLVKPTWVAPKVSETVKTPAAV